MIDTKVLVLNYPLNLEMHPYFEHLWPSMQALWVNKVKQLFLSRELSPCYLEYIFQVSLQARQLMRSLMQRNPLRRLGSHRGANDIKTHDFFKGIDWALLRNMVKLTRKSWYEHWNKRRHFTYMMSVEQTAECFFWLEQHEFVLDWNMTQFCTWVGMDESVLPNSKDMWAENPLGSVFTDSATAWNTSGAHNKRSRSGQ